MSQPHLTDIELIEWAAGNLSDSRQQELEQHLVACPDCRARLQAQRSLHDALGAWSPAASPDLWPAVARQLQAEAVQRRRRNWKLIQAVSGVAASVILGVGTGHVLSRLAASKEPKPPAAVTANEAADVIGVPAIAAPTVTGLDAVIPDAADNTQGDQP